MIAKAKQALAARNAEIATLKKQLEDAAASAVGSQPSAALQEELDAVRAELAALKAQRDNASGTRAAFFQLLSLSLGVHTFDCGCF